MDEEIPLKLIDPNPFQLRKTFNQEKIEGLARSIERQGLLHKVEARPYKGRYQLSHGEYRVKAFNVLKKKTIPAEVKDLTDLQMMIRAYVENVHRTDLDSVEREEAIHNLWVLEDDQGNRVFTSQKDLAEEIGGSNTRITELLDAYKFRLDQDLSAKIKTRTIEDTKGLCDSDRLAVIQRTQNGSLDAQDVRGLVRAVKDLGSIVRRKVITKKLSAEDAVKISKTSKDKQEQLTEFIVGVREEGKQLENFVVGVAQEKSGVKTISIGSNVDDIFNRYIDFYSSTINFEVKDVLSLPERMQQSVLNRVRGVMDFLRDFEKELSKEVEGVIIVKAKDTKTSMA